MIRIKILHREGIVSRFHCQCVFFLSDIPKASASDSWSILGEIPLISYTTKLRTQGTGQVSDEARILTTDCVLFLTPKAALDMDIDFPFCLQGLAPSQTTSACHPRGLWEAANCPIVQNSSRRQCARCPLPNGPATAVTYCPSQQPQPGQARDPNLRAFPRTVVYVPNTTPLLITGSGSKQTGLSPHFTDEENKAKGN